MNKSAIRHAKLLNAGSSLTVIVLLPGEAVHNQTRGLSAKGGFLLEDFIHLRSGDGNHGDFALVGNHIPYLFHCQFARRQRPAGDILQHRCIRAAC